MDSCGTHISAAFGGWAAAETKSSYPPLIVARSWRPEDTAVAVFHQAQPCLVMFAGPNAVRSSGGIDGRPPLHGQQQGGG